MSTEDPMMSFWSLLSRSRFVAGWVCGGFFTFGFYTARPHWMGFDRYLGWLDRTRTVRDLYIGLIFMVVSLGLGLFYIFKEGHEIEEESTQDHS